LTLQDNDRLTITKLAPKLSTTNPTERQAKVLDFIAEYWREFDSIPSLRTISQGIGLSSSSAYSVQTHLKELVSKGWLEKVDDGYGKQVWRFPR
jgi:SOS-response transcriptional repressor LexA